MHQCIKFILFWNDTLHVSDSLSVHHQQFKTVHTATGICQTDTAVCLLTGTRWSYELWMYERQICLLRVSHIQVFIPRKNCPCSFIVLLSCSKIQLDATYHFIMLMLGSTCFGHHYAHHQELTTIALVTTLAVWLSSCCWMEVKCRQPSVRKLIHPAAATAAAAVQTLRQPVHNFLNRLCH